MPSCLERYPALPRFLKGEPVRWQALGIAEQELAKLCEEELLSGLVYLRLSDSEYVDEWPPGLREALALRARADTAAELLRAAEVRSVLDDFAGSHLVPILIKGTPLAYSTYDTPACRPRSDTDLVVRESDVDAAHRVMAARGYRTTVHCNDLFSQFEVQKKDVFGVTHVFDVHWKISAQPVFADVLTYDELLRRSEPVPALGAHALAAGAVDALLLACVHPVMHHRNVERPLWTYDVHLLVSRLTGGDFEAFVDRACQKKMAAVCACGLRMAQRTFCTEVPDAVFRQLSSRGEPSAAYLDHGRRWHDELVSSVRGLPSWRGRLRLLRDVLFPRPHYMLGAYGLSQHPFGPLLLPALYLHRNVHGVWKILSGRK